MPADATAPAAAAREVLLGRSGPFRPRPAAQRAWPPGRCRHGAGDARARAGARYRAGLLRPAPPADPRVAPPVRGPRADRADGRALPGALARDAGGDPGGPGDRP